MPLGSHHLEKICQKNHFIRVVKINMKRWKITIDEWTLSCILNFFEEGHNWWMKCYKGLFTDVHRCKMQKWWMKLSLGVVQPEKCEEVQKWCRNEWMCVTWQEKSPTADLKKWSPMYPSLRSISTLTNRIIFFQKIIK